MPEEVEKELSQLAVGYKLPAGWKITERFSDSPKILGLDIHLAGLLAECVFEDGETVTVTGSAAEVQQRATERAYYELLERVLLLEAMHRPTDMALLDSERVSIGELSHEQVFATAPQGATHQYAKSNGVALGPDFEFASRRARLELLERDAVLRSWYGQEVPRAVPELTSRVVHSELSRAYEVQLYELPGEEVVTSVAAAFPRERTAPLLVAFAAHEQPEQAAQAAYGEMIQRLGFLWGEDIPTAEPAFSATPDYHQEMLLWPRRAQALRAWLGGAHSKYSSLLRARRAAPVNYLELSAAATGPVVVKAICEQCLPLTFGIGHPWVPELPEELRVHPIA